VQSIKKIFNEKSPNSIKGLTFAKVIIVLESRMVLKNKLKSF